MNPFILYQGKSKELASFPYIIEFANQKIQHVQLHSQEIKLSEGIKICFITEGKFDWNIDGQQYLLFPKTDYPKATEDFITRGQHIGIAWRSDRVHGIM